MTEGVNDRSVTAHNIDNTVIITGEVYGNVSNNSINDIKTVATEIKHLLDQLAQTNPDEAVIVNCIQTRIQHDPTLKTRLINALKAGGIEALKEIFAHPLVSVPVETIKGFLEA